jgi:hypothetical protein
MRKLACVASIALCCIGGSSDPRVNAQTPRAALTDWLTDGGDNQRTGWQRSSRRTTSRI